MKNISNMSKERKEYIDSLWRQTEFGQWVEAGARNDVERGKELNESMFSKNALSVSYFEKQLEDKIKKELMYKDEFTDYMKELEVEEPELLEFMLSPKHEIFADLW